MLTGETDHQSEKQEGGQTSHKRKVTFSIKQETDSTQIPNLLRVGVSEYIFYSGIYILHMNQKYLTVN